MNQGCSWYAVASGSSVAVACLRSTAHLLRSCNKTCGGNSRTASEKYIGFHAALAGSVGLRRLNLMPCQPSHAELVQEQACWTWTQQVRGIIASLAAQPLQRACAHGMIETFLHIISSLWGCFRLVAKLLPCGAAISLHLCGYNLGLRMCL